MTPILLASDPLTHVLDVEKIHITEHFAITSQIIYLWVASALVLVVFLARARAVRRGEVVPGRWGNVIEVFILFIRNEVVRPLMGREGDRYLPFVLTFFFFILACNLLGLVPIPGIGFVPEVRTPTGNLWVNATLAGTAFVIWHLLGIRKNGFGHYMASIVPPVPFFVWPIMLGVEFMGHMIRPCALAIRLFANMTAGHVLLAVIIGFTTSFNNANPVGGLGIALVSAVGVVLITFLELLVAFIQAFIFMFLTTVFISLAVHPEH